ncbi:uncharacterized protein [Henckelia pumila]|uniref:uncharacterized protein n=1 Tax=Henckelia pumila TaxID=405737 RepID=UPI003C6E8D9F
MVWARKGMVIEYAKNLSRFAASNGKKQVIILFSLDFGRWKSIDMSSLQDPSRTNITTKINLMKLEVNEVNSSTSV